MSDFQLHDTVNSIDHDLAPGETVIGRGADCGIRLLSSSVSRRHGAFECTDAGLSYSDLGSSNGSFVNGKAVDAPVSLHDGDELVLGELKFLVKQAGAPATSADFADAEATQLAPSEPEEQEEIPAVWSESAGLEDASGTQFFDEADESEAVTAYRQGKLDIPPIGEAPRLIGLGGHLNGKVFELTGQDKKSTRAWKLGRDADTVDLVIPDSGASGQHAQLVNEDNRWKVVNWMSTNGTFVNGEKGLSTFLKNGDVIRIGGTELAFELPAGGGKRAGGGGFMGLLRRLFKR